MWLKVGETQENKTKTISKLVEKRKKNTMEQDASIC